MGSIQFKKGEQNAGIISLDISESNAFTVEALELLGQALKEAREAAQKGEIKSLLLLSERSGYFSAGLDLVALGSVSRGLCWISPKLLLIHGIISSCRCTNIRLIYGVKLLYLLICF